MHTFFINTSKKSLNGYEVLFDIHYENKALVSMDCLMSDWYNEDKGYMACVKQMGDMIEGHVELNNAFNLIVYIDLPENKAYSAIKRDAFHDKEREECCRAMHILFTHVISSSIVDELINSGRRPQNVLIMFGEEKKFTESELTINDPSRPAIMRQVFNFIGLPEMDKVEEIAKAVDSGGAEDKVQEFRTQILNVCGEELVPGLRERYQQELQLWYDQVINEADISKANQELFDRVSKINKAESERIGIEGISCPYDCYASRVNKSILAVSQLNIALHLLQCVEANSVYKQDEDPEKKILLPFRVYKADEVAPLFKRKELQYSDKASEVDSLAKSYSELGLAPQLREFDHIKFGLDEYGDKARELVTGNAEKEPAKKKDAKDAEEGEDESSTILVEGNTKEVTVVEKESRSLFSKEEFPLFDYNYEKNSMEMLKKNTRPEQYLKQAEKVRMHHLDYLKELKRHTSSVLSNYAGKSKENKPALLQVGGYQYAGAGRETKVLESVENVSEKAYDTMLTQYMSFCASRSVAITDIEAQHNWFASRIRQIQESLQRISLVAIGLLVAMIALYIPFVLIQFESIAANVMTVTVALCSVAIPIVLLYLVFLFVTLAQKKKYLRAWKDFKARSDSALAENTLAAEKYDKLLSTVIPALRWVYEYKLDVDYCAECCDVADAKVEHHRRKLHDRAFAIRNILSDLEYREPEEPEYGERPKIPEDAIDFNMSFCAGKKNRAFYSVVDQTFFNPTN